jgi:hypothetical protein
MRGPEIGKKNSRDLQCTKLCKQVNAVVGAHKKGNRNTPYQDRQYGK